MDKKEFKDFIDRIEVMIKKEEEFQKFINDYECDSIFKEGFLSESNKFMNHLLLRRDEYKEYAKKL